jgi:signal transduction histidine kinase
MQIDSPLQRKWRGTGLGLSLSKKIAELLGGRVAMTSEPNLGSTFSVTIPLQFKGGPPGTGEQPKSPPGVESKLHGE